MKEESQWVLVIEKMSSLWVFDTISVTSAKRYLPIHGAAMEKIS
jgi:hypothetical protein